jgi:hypothetical protein
MKVRIVVTGTAALIMCLNSPVLSANFSINNPASNIYNPATQMDNPNPLSPPVQPVPQPAVTDEIPVPLSSGEIKERPLSQAKQILPARSYFFKTVGAYIAAAKKAYKRGDYRELISVTEDGLRRIKAGTLRASRISRQKLVDYKEFGYGLLEKGGKQ